ncbi:MAG: polysaccharide deacetylase family protein [Pirellulaceae bacterium]
MAQANIDIGFHTRSHCDCGELRSASDFKYEIVDGVEELRGELGAPVRYFAFPYGLPQNIPIAGIQAVYEAGFEAFCSAFGAYNFPGQDSFHIRRMHGDPEFSRLKNWLSFDTRKLNLQPEIRYWLPPASNWEETKALVG